MQTHKIFMRRAIQLAKLGAPTVAPNPMVGCVIVHEGTIIGEGYHMRYGGPHAEVNAINSVSQENRALLPYATLYVTLEPCAHYGKTPPCADLVLKHKIPKVYIGCTDPNPLVAGNSVDKLKSHDLKVFSGLLNGECLPLIKKHIPFVTENRPYLILKYAQSKDHFLGKSGEQIWLTQQKTKRLVHQWRSEESAILIGTNTAAVDNPSLTTRLWPGNSPTRLVLDRKLRLRDDLAIKDGSVKTLIFYDKGYSAPTSGKGEIPVRYVPLDFSKDVLTDLMSTLHKEKILSVIVEGGAQLLQSFLDVGLWDEARVFTADRYLGEGIGAPQIWGEPSEERMVGVDLLQVYYRTT